MSGRQNEAETGISGATEIGIATETATETGIATETGTATEVTGIESLDAAGGGAAAVGTAADNRRRREAARWRTGCATSPGWPMTDPAAPADPEDPVEEGEGKTCGKTAETTADPAAPEAWSEDPRWVSQRTKQKLNKNGKFQMWC